MSQPQVSIDTETFERTTSIFVAKRNAFNSVAIEALAKEIVRRLAKAKPRQAAIESPEIEAHSLVAFCNLLTQPDPDAALRFIKSRRAEGVSRLDVNLGYIAGAARLLGDGWETGRLSLLQVTYGTSHLYALMRALRAEEPERRPSSAAKRNALFATVPGEDHGIGITVAADIFREMGWEIDLHTDTDHDTLIANVEKTRPHIVGLSFSTVQRLDALVRLVVAIRIETPQAVIGVAPGSNISAKQLHDLADIDLVFNDVRTAYDQLDRLIDLRG